MSSRFCGRSRCQHPSSTQNWHLLKVWEMKSNFMGNEIKCLNIEWEMKSNFMENGFHFQNSTIINFRVLKGTLWYSRVLYGAQGYSMVLQSSQGYLRVP